MSARNTPATPELSVSSSPYIDDLLRRIRPIVIVMLVLIGIIGMVLSALATHQQIRSSHQATLIRTSDRLLAAMEDSIRTASTLSLTSELSFLNDIRESLYNTAQATFADQMRANPDIIALRYITAEGTLWLNVESDMGNPRTRSLDEVGQPAPNISADPAFQRALTDESLAVQIGSFETRYTDTGLPFNPPRAALTLYAPVLSDGSQPIGAVQFVVDARALLSSVNGVLEDDTVLLLVDGATVIADSGSLNTDYLLNLGPAGNVADQPRYAVAASAINAQDAASEIDMLLHDGRVLSGQALSLAGAAPVNWWLVTGEDALTVYQPVLIISSLIALLVIGGGLLAAFVLRQTLVPLAEPLQNAERMAQSLASGSTPTQITGEASAAPGLTGHIEAVARRIEALDDALQDQTRRRSRDLQVVGRIGRETVMLDDLPELLQRAIDLICTSLGYYHAQVFLLDDSSSVAVLAYSRGQVGQQLLARQHQLAVGSQSIVGQVAARQEPIIVNDTQDASAIGQHRVNPLLAETRAEIGLPLRIGEQIIGVLDIQSLEPDSFDLSEMGTFQLLADQLAVAIYNARLRDESTRRLQQVDRLNRRLIGDSWAEFQSTSEIEARYGVPPTNEDRSVSAPIRVRNAIIGSLDAALPEGDDFSDDDRLILNAVAERVALAIENARLFQQTELSLAETQLLYTLSSQLSAARTLDEVLYTVLKEATEDAEQVQLWLFDQVPQNTAAGHRVIATLSASITADGQTDATLIGTSLDLPVALLTGEDGDLLRVIDDLTTSPLLTVGQSAALGAPQIRTAALLPLQVRDNWQGLIAIGYGQADALTASEERLLRATIGQVGVAIDNRLLFGQIQEALARNERLYAAGRAVNTATDLPSLLQAPQSLLDVYGVAYWLVVAESQDALDGWPTQGRIVARLEQDTIQPDNALMPLYIPADSPLRRGQYEQIIDRDPDAPSPSILVRWLRQENRRSVTIFPLFSDQAPVGFLFMFAVDVTQLERADLESLLAISGQMSTQIQNRRLLERTAAALNETRRLYVASRAIANARDAETLYDSIAGHLASPFLDSEDRDVKISISILLAEPEARVTAPHLRYVFQWLSDPTQSPDVPVGTVANHQGAPFARLTDMTGGIFMYDPSMLPDEPETNDILTPTLRAILQANDARYAAVASISSGQSWFGVLIVRADQASLLEASYSRYLDAMTTLIAGAIERQRLLAETERERRNLDAILARMPTGVLVLDPVSFRPIQHNAQAEQLLGRQIDPDQPFSPQAYNLYRSGTNLYYPLESLAISVAQRTQQATTNDDVAVITPDGQVELLMNAAPIYDHTGHISGIVAALQDISNIRNLETTLQETLRETVTMYETQRALTEADTLDDLLDSLSLQLALQQPGDAYILLMDEEDNELRTSRYVNNALDNPALLRPLLHEFDVIRVDDTHHSAIVSDYPRLRRLLDHQDIRNLVSVPLRSSSRHRALGWLVMTEASPNIITPELERSLTSIGDIAATALDNRYLLQSVQVALADTEQLYRAATTISRSYDVEGLSEALLNALRALRPDMMAGSLVDGITQEITPLFSEGFEESINFGMNFERLLTTPLGNDGTLFVDDVARTPPDRLGETLLDGKVIASFAALDLRVQDMPGGRLLIGYRTPRHFQESARRYLTTVVGSASIVLDNQILLEQIQSTLNETSTLYQASRALNEADDPQDIIDVVTNYLIEPHVNQVLLMLLNGSDWQAASAQVTIAGSWNIIPEIDLRGVEFTPDEFPAWNLLATERVRAISDIYDQMVDLDPLEVASIESLSARSVVIIPLRVANRSLGALWIGSEEAYSVTPEQLRVYQAFAEQTSLSLETTRLLTQTERRARQLQTSAEISQRAGQILDLDVLLPQVVTLIKDQFNYDHAQVFLMDETGDWALLKASTGEAGRQLLEIGHKLRRGTDSVIGQVIERREAIIALDTTDAVVPHRPNPYLPQTRSEMALPLVVKGRMLGALDVQSNKPSAFVEEDIAVLRTLANQIAVAIDNANLYKDAERRAADMGFLFDITTSAAEAETLDEALQIISQQVSTALGADPLVIYMPQLYMDYYDNSYSTLRPVAVGGQYTGSNLPEINLEEHDAPLTQVARNLNPLLINDTEKRADYRPVSPETRSALLMPVIGGNDLVAVIALEYDRPNAYDDTILSLMLTLTGSLAAIIQNMLLVEQLQQSNEKLREIDQLKSQFLAAMSHELRTPLNSIIGFSRVMLKGIDGPLTEMQEQDLSTIYNSGTHLLNLINDILDQAKIEAKKMTLELDYFDVKAMIESVKSMTIGLLKEKPLLDLMVEIAPNLPKAFGDEFRTRQILINLTNNAVKFTTEGTVTIRAYHTTDAGQPVLRVDVVDTGIGIAEKDMPILFEQFRQVDSSLTRTVGGTGLGLPLSKSLAELQGGRLAVESEVGIGSTFSVIIPSQPVVDNSGQPLREGGTHGTDDEIADEADTVTGTISDDRTPTAASVDTRPASRTPQANGKSPEVDTRPPQAPMPAATNGNGSNGHQPPESNKMTQNFQRVRATQNIPIMPPKRDVLLIEDNKDMVDQYRRVLQREGFEVIVADHAAYAQAMVSNLRPTVVVLDVNFGDGQGWGILEELKSRDDTFDVPVVVTTLDPDEQRAYSVGAYRFLQRPFMPEILVEAVAAAETESQRQRILIIDDHPDSVRLMSELLEQNGNFRIFSALSGAEGIALVARRHPDLIILDLRMPDMDGFKVLSELRANPETQRIPVVVVTGEVDLSADEQQQLEHLRVLHKTAISQSEFDQFIQEIRQQLDATSL